MDFLANENFPLLSVKILRSSGHNVFSVIEDTPGAKDHDIIKRAQQEKRIVLTFDRDYGELIYRRRAATGVSVVYFRWKVMK